MKKCRMLMKLSVVVLVILLLLTSLPVGAFAIETDVKNVNSSVVSDKITIEDVAAGAATIQDLYGEDYVVDVPDSAVAVGTETETQTATTNMEYIDDMDGATIEELLASNKRVRSKEGDDLNKIVTANDDGSYTMRLFNHPVKFINEAGKIEDISLELKTSNNGGFETKAGVSRTQFSNKISNGISLSGNGVEIELLPSMNTVSSSTKATATLAMEQAAKTLPVTKIDKGAVSYYYDDKTTLEYSLTYTGFKEDIVVKEYTGQTEYNFTLNTNGLTLKCENGSYYLADENGEKKATIGTIVIFTADERNNTLGSMTHEVIKENELYMLTIHVDAEWLKDEKTVYPIRIDPTMEINYAYDGVDAIDDITINSNAGSDYDNDHIYIGKRNNYGISRVLMRFNYNFKNLFSDQRVIQRAHVEIRDIMCESTSMTVYARMFKGADWGEDNNTSWESVSQGEDTHSMPGVTVNYSLGNAKDPKHRYKINIMDAMKYWVSGEYDYRQGIVLRAPDSVENGTTELYKTFGSYQHTSYKPSLVITYLDHEQNCEPYGYLDAVESTNIRGWAWCIDAPNTPVRVKLYLENQTTGVTYSPITVQATTYRPDVESAGYGTGKYGFRYNIDWNDYSAGRYKVTAKALSMNGTTTEYILNNGTKYYENTGVKVSEQSLELGLGDTANLTATTYINGTTGWAVTWSSSNTSVATVDANGKVTAVGSGTTEITAIYGDYADLCVVTVSNINYSPSYIGVNTNKAYWIKEVGTSYYLTVEQGKWQSGSNIAVIVPRGNDSTIDKVDIQVPYLYWKFEYVVSEYRLIPFNSLEMMIGVDNDNNPNVELYDLSLNDLGAWKIVPTREGCFKILSKTSGYTKGLKIMSGNNISIYNSLVATEWEFVEVDCYGEDGDPLDYAHGHPIVPFETTYAQIYTDVPPSMLPYLFSNNISCGTDDSKQMSYVSKQQKETLIAKAENLNPINNNDMVNVASYNDIMNENCTVFKCAHCGELFFPPDLQDIYILNEEVYITILALQRSYVENIIEGDIIKAEATMRIINQLRYEFGDYDNISLYDFRDGFGNYVGSYKYLYDSYDGFYIEVTTTDTTAQIIDLFIVDTMANIPGPIGVFYSALSYAFRVAEYYYASTFSESISTTVFNDAVKDAIIEFSVSAIVIDAACKEFEFAVDCFRMAWGMNNILSENIGMYQYNYSVTIEYGVPQDRASNINKGKAVHCEYEFDSLNQINILQEGFKYINGYSGLDTLGQYKCNISNISCDWVSIAGN